MHPQESLLHHVGVHAPSWGLVLPWSSAVKDRRGPGHVIFLLLEAGAAQGFALPLRDPRALRLHGT